MRAFSPSYTPVADYNCLRDDISPLNNGMVGRCGSASFPLRCHPCPSSPRDSTATIRLWMSISNLLISRAIQRGLDDFELDGCITLLENEPSENVRSVALYREHHVLVVQREQLLAARKRDMDGSRGTRRLVLPGLTRLHRRRKRPERNEPRESLRLTPVQFHLRFFIGNGHAPFSPTKVPFA
jgi:hypothetical protein